MRYYYLIIGLAGFVADVNAQQPICPSGISGLTCKNMALPPPSESVRAAEMKQAVDTEIVVIKAIRQDCQNAAAIAAQANRPELVMLTPSICSLSR